ncbi:MAG TPA: hypothetical protein VKT70_11990, partial [Stellaceae bacterium]|nr:hypothetical protein [Stellaceae bacterium]
RGQSTITATYIFKDLKASGAVLATGTASIVTAFNILDDAYAARVAEDDARTKGLEDLSVEITTQLSLILQKRREAGEG